MATPGPSGPRLSHPNFQQAPLDDESEDVRIAVSALDHMRNSHRYRTGSSLESSTIASTSGMDDDMDTISETTGITAPGSELGARDDTRFLDRVGKMPVVSGALRAYEVGKNSNRVVKYGAGLVETSVKTIYGPVLGRAGRVVGSNNLNQLDEFACRQLDRFYTSNQGSTSSASSLPQRQQSSNRDEYSDVEENDPIDTSKDNVPAQRRMSNSSSSITSLGGSVAEDESQLATIDSKEATSARRGWQGMLVEAGMTAGGIGAAVSEESLKSLKYCLQWLMYASARLEHQLGVLQTFIASLSAPAPSDAIISQSAVDALNQIRRDVVETIRKVVDVIVRYSGAALPEHARRYVKQSILSLPVKWASNTHFRESSQEGVTAPSPSPSSISSSPSSEGMTKGAAEAAAQRVLHFTIESLEMVKSINKVFSESVERAELWVDRLESVGLSQRQRSSQGEMSATELPAIEGQLDESRVDQGRTDQGTDEGRMDVDSCH